MAISHKGAVHLQIVEPSQALALTYNFHQTQHQDVVAAHKVKPKRHPLLNSSQRPSVVGSAFPTKRKQCSVTCAIPRSTWLARYRTSHLILVQALSLNQSVSWTERCRSGWWNSAVRRWHRAAISDGGESKCMYGEVVCCCCGRE